MNEDDTFKKLSTGHLLFRLDEIEMVADTTYGSQLEDLIQEVMQIMFRLGFLEVFQFLTGPLNIMD